VKVSITTSLRNVSSMWWLTGGAGGAARGRGRGEREASSLLPVKRDGGNAMNEGGVSGCGGEGDIPSFSSTGRGQEDTKTHLVLFSQALQAVLEGLLCQWVDLHTHHPVCCSCCCQGQADHTTASIQLKE